MRAAALCPLVLALVARGDPQLTLKSSDGTPCTLENVDGSSIQSSCAIRTLSEATSGSCASQAAVDALDAKMDRLMSFMVNISRDLAAQRPAMVLATFVQNRNVQEFTVPAGVTQIGVHMWGAGGGGASCSAINRGGGGGYTTGTIPVTPGETLNVIVGHGGSTPTACGGGFIWTYGHIWSTCAGSGCGSNPSGAGGYSYELADGNPGGDTQS